MCNETIVPTPPECRKGLSDFGNCQIGEVGKIKIFGGRVTGSRGWYFQWGCTFSLITFFNKLRNWRNESLNFWLCSVQIFIYYHNTIVLKEQPLEVLLENRCSEKYVFWKVARQIYDQSTSKTPFKALIFVAGLIAEWVSKWVSDWVSEWVSEWAMFLLRKGLW